MSAALRTVVLSLAAVVVLLNGTIVIARVVLIRRQKQRRRLRPRAETLIAEYLADPSVRPPAATGRERMMLLEVALEAITDLRGEERARLVGLLEELGCVSDAIRALSARRLIVRRHAAEALATIGSLRASDALALALRDRDALVRVTCAYILAELGQADVVPAITGAILRDAALAPGATAAVILALGTKQPSALAPLLERDAPAPLRMTAVEVISELRLPQYLPTLRACLAEDAGPDSDDMVASAARGLGLIGDAGAVEALIRIASDAGRQPAVRAAAAQALGSIGDPRAGPVLEAQLRVPEWTLRAAATKALGQLGEPGAQVLRRAAKSDSAEVRTLAEAALRP
jgi:HEAT repeat protein